MISRAQRYDNKCRKPYILNRNVLYALYNNVILKAPMSAIVDVRMTSGVRCMNAVTAVRASIIAVSMTSRKLYESRHSCLLVLSKKIQLIKPDRALFATKNNAVMPIYIPNRI
jgi:hypothetical protein